MGDSRHVFMACFQVWIQVPVTSNELERDLEIVQNAPEVSKIILNALKLLCLIS